MTAKQIIPPFSAFNADKEKWSLYSSRLAFYFGACGIADDTEKKNYFLAWCGEELFAILASLVAPLQLSDPKVTFNDLIDLLNERFQEKSNFMAATYALYSCKQKPRQSISEWIAELREKARHCGFDTSGITDPRERALRDLLVLNCADPRIRQALLKEGDPSLKRAEVIAVQMEQLQKDMLQFQEATTLQEVSKIHSKTFGLRSNGNNYSSNRPSGKATFNGKQVYKCFSCGKSNHTRDQCKFRKYTCNICKKNGHSGCLQKILQFGET